MPDIFTSIFVISIFLFWFKNDFSIYSKITIGSILVFSGITHMSHLLIAIIIVIVYFVFQFIYRNKEYLSFIHIPHKQFITGTVVTLSILFFLPAFHWSVDNKFRYVEGSHIHLMASLNEKGILKDFLIEHCETEEFKDCKLCLYKDKLPSDVNSFIWEGEVFPNTGGWINSKEEYDKIIYATLSKPKYLSKNIKMGLIYGFSQLAQINVGEGLSAYNENSSPYEHINKNFSNEINAFKNSKQNIWNGKNLKFDELTLIQWKVIFTSLLISILVFSTNIWRKLQSNSTAFLLFAFITILANAFVTGALSSIYSRLNSRVIWILPLAIIIMVISNYSIFPGIFQVGF